jgi:hypothetical protein
LNKQPTPEQWAGAAWAMLMTLAEMGSRGMALNESNVNSINQVLDSAPPEVAFAGTMGLLSILKDVQQ